jgi:hypothetical protein
MRIAVLVVLLVWANGIFRNFKLRLPQWSNFAFSLLCGVVTLSLIYQSASTAAALSGHLKHDPAVHNRYVDSYWKEYMAGMTQAINSNSKRNHLSLWSEYAALLDASYGTFQPAEDYIIHTVGPERWHHYLETFRNTDPEFVTTMTPQFSFAEWLQDERWEFYEDLLNNYRPVTQVEHATLWQRQSGAWVYPAQNFQDVPFDRKTQSVVIPAAQTADEVVVVRIRYKISNPWRKLPLIGATPRYLIAVQGTPRNMAISVPPYLTEFQFPVKLPAGKTVTLHFQTDSFLPGASIQAEDVRMKTLSKQPATAALFAQRIIPSRY